MKKQTVIMKGALLCRKVEIIRKYQQGKISLTDLSRDGAEGLPNYVEQKQNPHDFRHRGFVLALPIFPGRLQPSIVGRSELNFRVRDGNGWTLALISTNLSAQQCSVMPTHVQLLAP